MPKTIFNMAKVYICFLVLGCSAFAQVSVTKDCGALGYPANDTQVIAACIADHPHSRIVFPKVNGCGTQFDYKTDVPLVPAAHEQVFEGEVGNGREYCGVNIWAPNGGVRLTDWNTQQGVRFDGLCFQGYGAPPDTDGVLISVSGVEFSHGCADHYTGHGFNIKGNVSQQSNASLGYFVKNRTIWNGGDGVHIEGGDAQVGTFIEIDAEQNSGYGINDQSAYGNTFIGYHGNANALGCINTKDGSVQSGSFLSPYCEGDQDPPHFGSGNIVLGGIFAPESNGRYSQSYTAAGWNGWTFSLINPYTSGNIALRMKSTGYKLLTFYTGNTEVTRFTVTAAGDAVINGVTLAKNGYAYFGQKIRFQTLYQSEGSVVTNSGCGGIEIKWNNSPLIAVGDPVGWRCVSGQWRSLGVIQ